MVSSPMYERLKVFMEAARSNRDLDAWDTDHTQTLKGLEESVERLKQYRDSQGFVGETAKAMNAWVDKAVARINGYKAYYQAGHTTYEGGRKAMATALKEAELLSPTLLDADTAAMRDNPVVMVPDSSPGGGVSVLGKRFTTGAAYVDAVEAQANAQREAAATRILERVNFTTGALSSAMQTLRSAADAAAALQNKGTESGSGVVGGVAATVGRTVRMQSTSGQIARVIPSTVPKAATRPRAHTRVVLHSRGGARPTPPLPRTGRSPLVPSRPRSLPTVRRGRARTRSRTPRTSWERTCSTPQLMARRTVTVSLAVTPRLLQPTSITRCGA